jgi:putative ABC transport system permease protein
MNIHLSSGRWFKAEDTIGRRQPVVITRHLAEALFGNEDPVGKRLTADDSLGMFVIGMTDFYRHKSSFQPNENCVFMAAGSGESSLVVHVAQGADAVFEAKLARSIQQLGKDWTVEIQHLDNMKANKDKIVLIPIIVLCVICGFLIINVALGLFGVLFQTISRRKGEIGIRRAMGATRGRILRQFVGETMMVTTLGILFGVFFAIQIPLLNLFDVEMIVYIWGIVLATVSVYGLTILCAYYPSRQASTIFPAAALHED